ERACPSDPAPAASAASDPLGWIAYDEQLVQIGHSGTAFAYDNETPRHKVYLVGFELADRLVTNAEYLAFIKDGGYARPELWLADGWDAVIANDWRAPLYWLERGGGWWQFTLAGLRR